MVSDGADTADAALGESLLGLKAEGLPVFTVGVGQETLSKDIQVGRVTTPKTALKGTTLMVDVVLSQSGFDGQTVTLDVEDEGTLVSTQQVTLPDAGTPASIPVRFTRDRGRAARVALPRLAAARRARHREQRARGAD